MFVYQINLQFLTCIMGIKPGPSILRIQGNPVCRRLTTRHIGSTQQW